MKQLKQKNFIDYVFSLKELSLTKKHEICRLYIRDRQKDLNDYKELGKEKYEQKYT